MARGVEGAGHRAVVIDRLPSTGTNPATLGDLAADAACVRRVLDDVDAPVALVGHSYGGMVITEVADHPVIEWSAYVAAHWPEPGQSVMDLGAVGPPPHWLKIHEDGTATVTEDIEVFRDTFAADLDPTIAAEAHDHLALQSLASVTAPSSAPDRRHPTCYIVCDHDRSDLPTAVQRAMATRADRVEHLPSAHLPMLSVPDALVGILLSPHGAA